jgi:hypothetical protein
LCYIVLQFIEKQKSNCKWAREGIIARFVACLFIFQELDIVVVKEQCNYLVMFVIISSTIVGHASLSTNCNAPFENGTQQLVTIWEILLYQNNKQTTFL